MDIISKEIIEEEEWKEYKETNDPKIRERLIIRYGPIVKYVAGKMRGRKYKSNAGVLVVVGKKEKIKTNAFETKNVGELSVVDLAKGGAGRLTIYTENAINELGARKQ